MTIADDAATHATGPSPPVLADASNARERVIWSRDIERMDAPGTMKQHVLRAKDPLMQSRTSLVHGAGADEAYGLIHHDCVGSVLSVCVSPASHAIR
jgi:hypothetical protein